MHLKGAGKEESPQGGSLRAFIGAAEKTRTSTGYYPTATSTLRVYQFRHGREVGRLSIKEAPMPQAENDMNLKLSEKGLFSGACQSKA